jgi:hypothetical protein
LSVAVTATELVPAVVGVPVMPPVEESMERPAGSPVAEYEMVAVDEVSVAPVATEVMADPDTSVWLETLFEVTVLVMVQVKVANPKNPWGALSVAVTVTEQEHAVVGVPVMWPLLELIDSPAGRPVAV